MGYVSFREGIPLKIVFKKRKVYKIDIFIEKKTLFSVQSPFLRFAGRMSTHFWVLGFNGIN